MYFFPLDFRLISGHVRDIPFLSFLVWIFEGIWLDAIGTRLYLPRDYHTYP